MAKIYDVWPFDADEALRRRQETALEIGKPVEKVVSLGYDVTEGWLIFKKTIHVDCPMRFILIPAGEFMMGSPTNEAGRRENEGPLHRVRISKPFYMSVAPVTEGQFNALMGKPPRPGKLDPELPVSTVSFQDWQDFAKKLSGQEFVKARLAREAEWEYACRAGSDAAYFFGSEDIGLAAHAVQGLKDPPRIPVGTKAPNAWGDRKSVV